MPCNSDYMEPSAREAELQETAYLLEYALRALKREVPWYVSSAAGEPYCSEDRVVPDLCSLVASLDKRTLNRVVYNGRNATARRLADWWDRHKEADRARLSMEEQQRAIEQLRTQALAKLTDEEKHALGLAGPPARPKPRRRK